MYKKIGGTGRKKIGQKKHQLGEKRLGCFEHKILRKNKILKIDLQDDGRYFSTPDFPLSFFSNE